MGIMLLNDHWFGFSPCPISLFAKSKIISSRSQFLMTSGGMLSGPAAFPSVILDFAFLNHPSQIDQF